MISNLEEIRKGDFVEMTEAARRSFNKPYTGIVCGFCRDGQFRIIRTGHKSAATWAAIFWRKAQGTGIVSEILKNLERDGMQEKVQDEVKS